MNAFRFIYLLLIILLPSACQFIRPEKTVDEIVAENLPRMDWKEVDKFPLFEGCDEMSDRLEARNCFDETLNRHLYTNLAQNRWVVHSAISDTAYLELSIDHKGIPTLLKVELSEDLLLKLPQLDSALHAAVAALPKIHPALKRIRQGEELTEVPVSVYGTVSLHIKTE